MRKNNYKRWFYWTLHVFYSCTECVLNKHTPTFISTLLLAQKNNTRSTTIAPPQPSTDPISSQSRVTSSLGWFLYPWVIYPFMFILHMVGLCVHVTHPPNTTNIVHLEAELSLIIWLTSPYMITLAIILISCVWSCQSGYFPLI